MMQLTAGPRDTIRLTLLLVAGLVVGFSSSLVITDYIVAPLTSESSNKKPKTGAQAIAQLQSGGTVHVILNRCPQDEEGWDGANDPLGTIKCGEIYRISYLATEQKWLAIGLHEGQNKVLTLKSSGPNPNKSAFSIWGAVFVFRPDGSVWKKDPIGRNTNWGYLDF